MNKIKWNGKINSINSIVTYREEIKTLLDLITDNETLTILQPVNSKWYHLICSNIIFFPHIRPFDLWRKHEMFQSQKLNPGFFINRQTQLPLQYSSYTNINILQLSTNIWYCPKTRSYNNFTITGICLILNKEKAI